jgi:hypothetical protein
MALLSLFIFNFKDMGKKVGSILIFLVLLFSLFLYLNKVYATRNIFVNVYEDYTKLSAQANIDVLFYGSSHSYTAFNPLIIDKVCKTISFNLGSAALHVSLAEMTLKETLKNSNPKLVILEVFKGALPIPTSKKAKGYQLRALDIVSNFSLEKYERMKSIYTPKEYLGVYFPLIRNRKKWNEYNLFNLSRRQVLTNRSPFFYAGYRGHNKMLDSVSKKRYKTFKEKTVAIDSSISFINDQSKQDIKNFIATAKKRGIEVLVISSPDLRVRFDNYRIFDEFKALCEISGASFLNLNDYYREMELILGDFMDPGHLNIYGGTKVSTFLANYINEHYSLPDRSSETVWKDTYKIYEDSKDLFVRNVLQFKQLINFELIEDVVITNLEVIKNNRRIDITIDIDESNSFVDDFEGLNLSFKVFPQDIDELSEKSKTLQWKFDSTDLKLKGVGSKIEFSLYSRIMDIEKIEVFLFNSEKHPGVVGKKLKLTDVVFQIIEEK